jgi:hypothetical protein
MTSISGVGGQSSNQKRYHGVLWEEVLKHTDIKLEGSNTCRLSAVSRLIGSWYFMYCRQFTKFTTVLYPLKYFHSCCSTQIVTVKLESHDSCQWEINAYKNFNMEIVMR